MGGGYHFNGDLSRFEINKLVAATISSGSQPKALIRGNTVAYVKTFGVISPNLPPEAEDFTLRVVVNQSTNNVTTVYSTDDETDSNALDQCNWAGTNLCAGGVGPGQYIGRS